MSEFEKIINQISLPSLLLRRNSLTWETSSTARQDKYSSVYPQARAIEITSNIVSLNKGNDVDNLRESPTGSLVIVQKALRVTFIRSLWNRLAWIFLDISIDPGPAALLEIIQC